ncbi:hypothetical protein D3C81_884660 [compost metagenome]
MDEQNGQKALPYRTDGADLVKTEPCLALKAVINQGHERKCRHLVQDRHLITD